MALKYFRIFATWAHIHIIYLYISHIYLYKKKENQMCGTKYIFVRIKMKLFLICAVCGHTGIGVHTTYMKFRSNFHFSPASDIFAKVEEKCSRVFVLVNSSILIPTRKAFTIQRAPPSYSLLRLYMCTCMCINVYGSYKIHYKYCWSLLFNRITYFIKYEVYFLVCLT